MYLGNAPNGEGYKLFSWSTFSYIVCRSIEFYEGESVFGIKKARSYMNELDPELLYKLLEDEEEKNDTDGSFTDSSTDSLEKAQEHAEPVIAGSGGGISHSGLKGEGVAQASASNSPHNASNEIPKVLYYQ